MWDSWYLWVGAAVAAFLAGAAAAWRVRGAKRPAGMPIEEAKKKFHLRREWMEAHFFSLASVSGKPRGLQWLDCDFENDVSFARDRASGDLRAFTAVTIRFAAVEGGGMEGNENVGRLRSATAVFLLRNDEWITEGRAIFNLSPDEAIQHFREELEVVE